MTDRSAWLPGFSSARSSGVRCSGAALSKLAHGEQRTQVKALGGKVLPAAGLAVDRAQHRRDVGLSRAQLTARLDDLPARSHHVLNDSHPASCDLAALGETTGSISLGRLADEDNRQPGNLRGDDRERYTIQLKTGEHFRAGGEQADQGRRDLAQQVWV